MRMFILCGCTVWPRRAFVPCSRLQHCSIFPSKNRLRFLPYLLPFFLLPFQSDCVPCSCGHVCRTFAQTVPRFISNGFKTVFKRSFVWRIYLHRLTRFVRLYSLICGKFAVLRGRGGAPPKPKRREAQLRSRRILYFLNPKKFFLKNLVPPIPCLLKFFSENFLFYCQNSLFLKLRHVCVPKKPHRSPNLLKETPF